MSKTIETAGFSPNIILDTATSDTAEKFPRGISEEPIEPGQERFSKEQFHNVAEYAEWKIRARLGLYSSEHPISQYAQRALERVGGPVDPEKPRITVYKGNPNAFVFPNGSIYLSDQLLKLVGTDEELMFVLMHERIHYLEAHSENAFKRAEDPKKTFSDIMLGGLGLGRVHEWEGDLRAFTELDNRGINPMGGIELLEKFRANPKLSGDAIHGKTTDRALNLRAMTYLKDLASIEKPFHPIPEEIKLAVDKEQSEGRFTSLYDQFMKQMDQGFYFKTVDHIDRMDMHQALVVLQAVLDRYDVNRTESKGKGLHTGMRANFQSTIIPVLGKKIWEDIAQTMAADGQPVSNQRVSFAFYQVLALTVGAEIDIHDKRDVIFQNSQSLKVRNPQTGVKVPWEARKFSLGANIYAEEDIDDFLKVLDPALFTRLGLKIHMNPINLVQNVVQAAFDSLAFEEDRFLTDVFLGFADRITQRLAALYKEHGGVEFDAELVHGKIMETAKANLSEGDLQTLVQRVKAHSPAAPRVPKEVEEKEYSDKMLNTFKEFAMEVRRTLQDDAIKGLGKGKVIKIDVEDQYYEALKQIFEEKQIQSPREILIFLANFRKMAQEDKELWGLHAVTDDLWNPIVDRIVTDHPVLEQITDPLVKNLFELKVSVLLAHSGVSNILSAPTDRFGDFISDQNLNINLYREFYAILMYEDTLAKETGVKVTTDTLLGFGKNGEWVELLREGKYWLLERAVHSSSREKFGRFLEQLTNDFPFNHYGVERNEDRDEIEARRVKRRFLNKVFKTYQFNTANISDLKTVYYLSTYLEDQALAIRLQNVAWAELSKRFTFEEGFAFLEKELNSRRLLSLKAVTDFVEHNAKTHDEIELATSKLIGLATQDSSLEGIGKLVMTEELVTKFFLDDKYDLLLACIGNGEDDSYLKRYLYQRWVVCMDFDRLRTIDDVHLDDLMQRLYRLDAQSKYIFIRDLLTGDKGILTNPDITRRLSFVDFFLDNYIEVQSEEDANFFRVIKEVMHEVVRTANYDLIYFALSPILQERMLIQPENQLSWLDVIRTEEPPPGFQDLIDENENDDEDESYFDEEEYDRERLASLHDYYDLDENGELYGERANQERQQLSQSLEKPQLPEFTEQKYQRRVDEKDVGELYKYITGSSTEQSDRTGKNQVRREYENIVEGLLVGAEDKPAKQKMTVNEFILETAQKLGAPGVRFLQLIGQYVELPPQLEQSFNQVYDKVSGQSKITANQTLLREWPIARDRLVGLRQRLGGGSLMSVFMTNDLNGRDLALKILNPNSGHHTETTYKLLNTVFTSLSQRDARFAPSTTLLTDIREWIRNDIDFEGFLEQDRRFRRKHDGYAIGRGYRIRIPATYPPENKYFSQEDYIEGTNLTEIDKLQRASQDVRHVVSLVTRNFFEQIKDGQVHSDIHPGNIRVMSDGGVAFLDRNYYLQFGLRDKLFLRGLQGALENTARATEMSLDYMRSQGVHIDKEQRQRILVQAKSLSDISDPTDRLLRLAVILRREDLRFPIKTTLLIKDFFYLDRMAKRVGFANIADAAQARY